MLTGLYIYMALNIIIGLFAMRVTKFTESPAYIRLSASPYPKAAAFMLFLAILFAFMPAMTYFALKGTKK